MENVFFISNLFIGSFIYFDTKQIYFTYFHDWLFYPSFTPADFCLEQIHKVQFGPTEKSETCFPDFPPTLGHGQITRDLWLSVKTKWCHKKRDLCQHDYHVVNINMSIHIGSRDYPYGSGITDPLSIPMLVYTGIESSGNRHIGSVY